MCLCMLGFACVGGVAVKRPMTSGHEQRADGQADGGMSGRTSWRVGGFYAYTYTFFICWHFAIYFIFVLLETAAWQRQQQKQQLCPVTSFSSLAVVVGAAQRPFSPEMSLSLCPSGCLFVRPSVCLSVCVLLLCQRRRQRTATRVALFRSALWEIFWRLCQQASEACKGILIIDQKYPWQTICCECELSFDFTGISKLRKY